MKRRRGHVLTISGERKYEKETKDEDLYLSERAYGRFERRLVLPEGIDSEKLGATYTDGVLTIRVPMPAETPALTRKVNVRKR